jgi:hypothetical protein
MSILNRRIAAGSVNSRISSCLNARIKVGSMAIVEAIMRNKQSFIKRAQCVGSKESANAIV